MGDLTPCNFCNLARIKRARLRGESIKVVPSKESKLGGFNIYKLAVGEKINHDRDFIAWMMEIPDECAC